MVDVPRIKLESAITSPNPYGISVPAIARFLRTHTEDYELPVSLGGIEATQYNRERLGPVFVDHALQRTMAAVSIEQVPDHASQADFAKKALAKLLAMRNSTDGRAIYRTQQSELLKIAAEQRSVDPLVDNAMATAEVLHEPSPEAATIATDVVMALGYLARYGTSEFAELQSTAAEGKANLEVAGQQY